MISLKEFNQQTKKKAKEDLFNCCGSKKWVNRLMQSFPFKNEKQLHQLAQDIWYNQCSKKDYLEAFSHHPKIGDVKSLTKKFAATKEWAGNEQGKVKEAAPETIKELAKKNKAYEKKNGFIFIVCATGKSAGEMLDLLTYRLLYDTEEEMNVAMGEQFKITIIRLKKLLDLKNDIWNKSSHVTTHVLDTSKGFPGRYLQIQLKEFKNNKWLTKSMGVTNDDGRIPDLLAPGVHLEKGHYKMVFNTGDYFKLYNTKGFYPEVTIDFTIFDNTHYHVPLLINPYGYSTYRGS